MSQDNSNRGQEPTAAEPAEQDLIEYPSAFPIKVVGVNEEHFVHEMTSIAEKFDPEFDASTITMRESGAGKYLAVTLTVTATSRDQLDSIYRAITAHPMTRWAL